MTVATIEAREQARAAPSRSSAHPLDLAGGAALLAGLLLVSWGGPEAVGVVVGSWLLAVAAGCAVSHRVHRGSVAVVVSLVLLALLALALSQRLGAANPTLHEVHDGGVVITDASADAVLHGRNPYAADFTTQLLDASRQADGTADPLAVDNPVAVHVPYLPGAVLLDAAPTAVAEALGLGWDARLLYLGIVAATVAVVLRTDRSAGVRLAICLAVLNPMTFYYLLWGSNDAAAGCLVLLAVLLARTRPALAGVLLALALSFKPIVAIMVLPLLLAVWLRGGRAALVRWWTLPATLAATALPFLLAGPGDLVEDTVRYNLGLTAERFPTSGIGLPARFGLFHGPVLALATLGLTLAAILVPILLVRRGRTEARVAVAACAGFVLLLTPARTFQVNYLLIPMAVSALVWTSGRLPTADRRLAAAVESP